MITTSQYLLLFILTFLLVGIITPWMRRIALKLNFVDKPNAAHKTHSQAIPYLGGVAIIVGILATVYGSILSQENMRDFFWLATSLYDPALFLGVVGLIDVPPQLVQLTRIDSIPGP